jgi:flagellar assembly protein FliH
MAITEPPTARVIRRAAIDEMDGHAFGSIADLPRLAVGRPRQTGNRAVDAVRTAAWDEGYAAGLAQGSEEGRAAGFDQGLAEGRAAGHRDGVATAHAEARRQVEATVSDTLAGLGAAAADLVAREAPTFAEVESAAIGLALELAEAILDREITVADDPGRDALRRALALAPDHDALVAHLHPADLERLGEVAGLAPGRDLRLVADPSVRSGGCQIVSGAARIDARIESALQRVREVLSQ